MKSKKSITLFIIHFFLLSLFNYVSAQPVKVHGQLKVVGTQLTDEHNNPVVLRGMSLGWHCFHPRFYTVGTVHWLHKDWKCSVIRAAIGIEPKGGYIDDPATAIAKANTVIDAAIHEGIYVIIDFHSHHVRLNEAKAFFTKMATLYGKYPNIIYELFNEPDNTVTSQQVKDYATELITTIRAIDPNNIILVGSPHWDQDIDLPMNDSIRGFSNIMYTMHFYAGTHKQWLRDRTDMALQHGLPIFISESAGMEASGDGPIDTLEWRKYIDWAEARKLSWITWSVSDKDETCSILQISASPNGKWKQSDLKESGIRTRDYLRKYNAQIK